MNTKDEPRLRKACHQALHHFGGLQSVTGIDVGYKYRDGRRQDEIAVRFHVRRKLPLDQLDPSEALPQLLDGIPTDVVEATFEAPEQRRPTSTVPGHPHQRRLKILQPGCSISRAYGDSAGTFGALVYDNASGTPALLSNWHVLVGHNGQVGQDILQPGVGDGGRRGQDEVAQLQRILLGLQGDAAIAPLIPDRRPVLPQILGSKVSLRGARSVRLGEILHKSGRSTSVTAARVVGIGRYFLTYPVGRLGIDGFMLAPAADGNPDNEEISTAGDSGAIWYDPESEVGVGLLFAGEPRGLDAPEAEYSLACHLPRVLAALDVSLLPGGDSDGSSMEPVGDPLTELVADWVRIGRKHLGSLRSLLRGEHTLPVDQQRRIHRQVMEAATHGTALLWASPEGQVRVVLQEGTVRLNLQWQDEHCEIVCDD